MTNDSALPDLGVHTLYVHEYVFICVKNIYIYIMWSYIRTKNQIQMRRLIDFL